VAALMLGQGDWASLDRQHGGTFADLILDFFTSKFIARYNHGVSQRALLTGGLWLVVNGIRFKVIVPSLASTA
jgi:hypothetical protein